MPIESHENADLPLAVSFGARMMPERGPTDVIAATRRVGAHYLIEHLIGGDWGKVNPEYDTPLIEQFLARVAANAARQGIGVKLSIPEKD